MSEEKVTYKKSDIIKILRDLNILVVSLDRIGSVYSSRKSDDEYDTLSSSFLTEWDVTRKLARARKVLEKAFSQKLGDDEMDELDELEKEFQDLQYWSLDNPLPKNKRS